MRSWAWPLAAVVLAMVSIQVGAALAKGLFASVGPTGATTLRLVLAAAILYPIFRAWRRDVPVRRGALLGYGLALGFMNLSYYLALERLPMGVVVATEFLGPLGVAVWATRRRVDFAWVLLAVAGLLLLLPWRTDSRALDPVGLVFALLAGLGWASYIVFGTRAGGGHGGVVVARGMLIAALGVLPAGAVSHGIGLLQPAALPVALLVAVLSSALPYSLEMYSMQRLPTRTFGILMSVEPALAAMAGLVLLGERLSGGQWLAIACVMAASVGSTWSASRQRASVAGADPR